MQEAGSHEDAPGTGARGRTCEGVPGKYEGTCKRKSDDVQGPDCRSSPSLSRNGKRAHSQAPRPGGDRATRGMVLGKFLPPHSGHRYLIDFARRLCGRLTVVVGSLSSEPIAGSLRHAWMKEAFPSCRVLHLEEELPQHPSECENFWELWRRALLEILDGPVDLVFASEDYGPRLAAELGARFLPADPCRKAIPVSATLVRSRPFEHWDHVLSPARRDLLARVCLTGAESTGKSTLAAALAECYGSVYVPEYARTLIEHRPGELRAGDFHTIALGQAASEESLAPEARGVLFADTDPLLTVAWYEYFHGAPPDDLLETARRRSYDLHLVCDCDIPWRDDAARFMPSLDERRRFTGRCIELLEQARAPYVIVSGSGEARLKAAVRAVDDMLARKWPWWAERA